MKIIIIFVKILFCLFIITPPLTIQIQIQNRKNFFSSIKTQINPQQTTQCKMCIDMFNFNFNYDIYISQRTLNSNEKMKNVAKEISVQYFLKGISIPPSQKKCSLVEFGSNPQCDSYKETLCGKLLDVQCNVEPPQEMEERKTSFVDMDTGGMATQNIEYETPKPQTVWSPSQPVLLDNFQNNIGEQLKEISILTNEVAKTEKHLKELKQKLSNKLEIVQSSYNAVQKTLADIAKMINDNNFSLNIKNNLVNSNNGINLSKDEDWDQHSTFKLN